MHVKTCVEGDLRDVEIINKLSKKDILHSIAARVITQPTL